MTYQEKYAPFFERLSQYSNLSLLQQVFYEEDITSGIKNYSWRRNMSQPEKTGYL